MKREVDAHAVLVPQPHGDHRRGVALVRCRCSSPTTWPASSRQKEQHDVLLWAHAMERVHRDVSGDLLQDPLIADIMSNGNNIPFIITDENLEVINFHLIPEEVIDHPEKLRRAIDRLSEENTPIPVKFWWAKHYHIIFYGHSALLKVALLFPLRADHRHYGLHPAGLRGLPLVEARRAEPRVDRTGQGRPPTSWARPPRHCSAGSSICGRNPSIREAVEEMNKDLAHLMKIVDRFSKIGSETPLTPANINETVGESVMYFRKRIPRNVTLDYNGLAIAPRAGRQHQYGALRMGGREPDEELARRPFRATAPSRCASAPTTAT